MKKLILLLIPFLVLIFSQRSAAQTTSGQEVQVPRDSVRAYLARAQALARQGNTVEATKIYLGIMKSEPNNRDAVQGWLMVNMKRSPTGEEEAIKSLEDLGRTYPENTGIIFFKAFLEAEHGLNEDALKDVDKLIKAQPDTSLNYILKGQTLSAMQRHKEAVEAFNKATVLDPKRWDVWGMKAGAEAKTGDYDAALKSMEKAFELAPNVPVNLYNRACIYSLKGDKAKAVEDLKKAVSMNPAFREMAKQDEDFKNLQEDEEFKKLIAQ